MEVQFFLSGNVPSQKNSKRIVYNSKTKKPFIISSERTMEWKKGAKLELRGFEHFEGSVEIEMEFYRQTRRAFDLENAASTVLDLLVANKIIEDDNCFIVQRLCLKYGGVNKDKAGVKITIRNS